MSECKNEILFQNVGPIVRGVFPVNELVLTELGPNRTKFDLGIVVEPTSGEVIAVVRHDRARPELVCELDGCDRTGRRHHAAANVVLCEACFAAATGVA